jgi:hypothetical protein
MCPPGPGAGQIRVTRVHHYTMKRRTGFGCVLLAGLLGAVPASAQSINNQSLTGKYYFRQVSLGTVAPTPQTPDPRSLWDDDLDGSGAYLHRPAVDRHYGGRVPNREGRLFRGLGGFVSLDSPPRRGQSQCSRGPEAVIAQHRTSDIPSISSLPFRRPPAGGLRGPNAASRIPGRAANMRHSFVNQSSAGNRTITVNGHAAKSLTRAAADQTVSGGTTPSPPMEAAPSPWARHRTRSCSAAAGRSPLGLGQRAVGGSIHSGRRYPARRQGMSGARTPRGTALLGRRTARTRLPSGYSDRWLRAGRQSHLDERIKALGWCVRFTGIMAIRYRRWHRNRGPHQSGSAPRGRPSWSSMTRRPRRYEIYFGVGAGAAVRGLPRPLGITSAASSRPAATHRPGDSRLLARPRESLQTATVPYPATLNGVTVTINGKGPPLLRIPPRSTRSSRIPPPGPPRPSSAERGQLQYRYRSPGDRSGVFTSDQSGSGIGAMRPPTSPCWMP